MGFEVEPGKVLVIDDVEMNRTLARAFLELLGWTVDECDGSYAALRYLREHTPEYILLDIRMPDIDGVALAKMIRQTCPAGTVRLVAYTAHALASELESISASGFDKVLVKPVSFVNMTQAFGTRDQEIFTWL